MAEAEDISDHGIEVNMSSTIGAESARRAKQAAQSSSQRRRRSKQAGKRSQKRQGPSKGGCQPEKAATEPCGGSPQGGSRAQRKRKPVDEVTPICVAGQLSSHGAATNASKTSASARKEPSAVDAATKATKAQKQHEQSIASSDHVHTASQPLGACATPHGQNMSEKRRVAHSVDSLRQSQLENSALLALGGNWESLYLSSRLVNQLTYLGYAHPTRVQYAVLPKLLHERKDCIVCSSSGSGKTLAYTLAIIQSLANKQTRVQRSDGTKALILAPTRELVSQIASSVVEKLLRAFHWIVGGTICGGMKRKAEKHRIRRGVNVLVATPGRLHDHLKHTLSLSFANTEWLVLDETDRLLDLGFEKSVMDICQRVRTQSLHDGAKGKNISVDDGSATHLTSCLVSATLSQNVERIASAAGLITTAERVRITDCSEEEPSASGSVNDSDEYSNTGAMLAPPPVTIRQRAFIVPAKYKLAVLRGLLARYLKREGAKMIVFVSCCETAEFYRALLHELQQRHVLCLHGSVPQSERQHVHATFKESTDPIALICTDVAARGLDFPQLSATVQYDPSGDLQDYVHRIGRAARFGRVCEAILFQTPVESYVDALKSFVGGESCRKIEHVHGAALADETLAHISDVVASKPPPGTPTEQDPRSIEALQQVQRAVNANEKLKSKAQAAMVAHMRAYAAHPRGMKEYLPLKQLPKGHIAASMGLSESPKQVSQTKPAFF
jgi:ATP-dependent RNA helicase DDX31/DBP7